mmetsp:Transcript_6699/g.18763  ORF Transcript_6699/g.18763 Transcript_6699/m.18763 type:complete len:92 (-) Transcript_6699:335-610(-)|eukprot:CAMPEP_0117669104 /NCGR_PEP_ID=MMETSP0804-20121206/11930_1 /TAXON_ID=1074897 /ORGANISM="Tetraselmis astigmatica, Strain CCMP880" /LENGTH=91 /DNA_ID=CAMNT_0005477091 /DNA_START=54 /DNA_END=329 /DNA_ORIENTATION=-
MDSGKAAGEKDVQELEGEVATADPEADGPELEGSEEAAEDDDETEPCGGSGKGGGQPLHWTTPEIIAVVEKEAERKKPYCLLKQEEQQAPS